MCFTIKKGVKVAKIATEDILVYKVLRVADNGTLWSPIQTCEWKIGKPKIEDKLPRLRGFLGSINLGLHAKLTYKAASYFKGGTLNQEVFEAKIPKGSLYWINEETNETVSDQLLIVSGKPLKRAIRRK